MRTLTLLLVACGLLSLLTGSASAAGCAPITCAGSGTLVAGTSLLAVRPAGVSGPVRMLDLTDGTLSAALPRGILAGRTLLHVAGGELQWIDATTGAVTRSTTIPAGRWTLAGASTDGRRGVVQQIVAKRTTFAILGDVATRTVSLPRNWQFDALSGGRLYLLEVRRAGYLVRLYDLARGRLAPKPLKDAGEAALIAGIAWTRVVSPDGSHVFTLYVGSSGEAMIHDLDVVHATARCIDLPGRDDFNAAVGYGLAPSADERTVWAASAGYGRIVAVDVRAAKVRSSFAFTAWAPKGPIAPAVGVDRANRLLALSVNGRTLFASLAARHVAEGPRNPAIAVGFAPDASRLWAVDGRGGTRAIPVPVR